MSIINKPAIIKFPIVLSIPHTGIQFPEKIKNDFKQHLLQPDDTDWKVNWLYDFAASEGIATISAIYSRWVIDVNRYPGGEVLYNDGRMITGLCPVTDFAGNKIYNDDRSEVAPIEVQWRKDIFFYPYQNAVQVLLEEVKEKFGGVLLWDCHSIRRHIPSLQSEPIPDLILGSADGISASADIIEKALSLLQQSSYSLSHNHPFKGGYITRHFGKPHLHQHALQLEMVKQLYMDDEERNYEPAKANAVRYLLKETLLTLGNYLLQIYPKKDEQILLL